MKKTLSLLTLLFIATQAFATTAEIESTDYVSFRNFQMTAFEVIAADADDRIKIIVKKAALAYPDGGPNFEQINKFAELFELEGLNALIITYAKKSCMARNVNEEFDTQIFQCSKYIGGYELPTTIEGAKTDPSGAVIAVSHIEFDADISSRVLKVAGQDFPGAVQARATGTIMVEGKSITLGLVKSNLSVR